MSRAIYGVCWTDSALGLIALNDLWPGCTLWLQANMQCMQVIPRQVVVSCLAGGATPAPGDYDAAHPSAAAAPAWTMGTKAAAAAGTAAAMDQQLQPGPGYYTPVDPVRDDPGVAFSIGGKWKEAAAGGGDGPAPGEYEVPTGGCGELGLYC